VASNIEAIKATLNAYRDALVASSVDDCVKLYAEDGVTMAQGFPTQVGHDAVKVWYTKCFETLTLDVKFDIREVIVASDQYAFARTNSAGTQKINKTGKISEEANQEVCVTLRRTFILVAD
jgi:uncharacterized protein (TIGR02246 family)